MNRFAKGSIASLLVATMALSGCMGFDASGSPSQGPVGGKALERAWSAEDSTGIEFRHALGATSRAPGPIDAPATAYDLDGDGHREILVSSLDKKVHIFDSQSGRSVAELPQSLPPSWYVQSLLNQPEAGVLEPGQQPSIVVVSPASIVTVWRFDPEQSDEKDFHFEKVWETRTDSCHRSPGADAEPVLADLTGDGKLEILVHTEETGFFALRSDGSTLWEHCWAGGNDAPLVVDLDGDGDLEAVFASDSGFVSVIDGKTGNPEWTFDAADEKYGIKPAAIVVRPTAADLTGDGRLELVFTARHAPSDDEDLFEEFSMGIFAIRQDPKTHQGELLWMRQPEWANPLSYTRLVVEDVDHDGKADIFGMDWNTVGHRPGNWDRLPHSNLFRLTAEGEDVWVREVEAWWSNKDIVVADVDEDGSMEVLANAPAGSGDGLWRVDAATGSKEGHLPIDPWKVMRGPQLFDLDGDGSTELVMSVGTEEENPHGAVLVYDLGVPFEKNE